MTARNSCFRKLESRWVVALALLAGTLLAAGCNPLYTVPVDQRSSFPGVTMDAELRSSGIDIVVHNDTDLPVTIIWSESTYVYANGEADRLVPLELGDTTWTGDPRNETIPANASVSTFVAPQRSIDPATGYVSIPWGPAGASVRVVLAVERGAQRGTLDYRYLFQAPAE